jgi:UDP-glucose 4-epimerase
VLSAGRMNAASDGPGAVSCEQVNGDFADREFVRFVLSLRTFDRIIFAAGPADVQGSFKGPVADFEQQTLPLLHLIEESRKFSNPAGVLLVSSAAVYGNPLDIPVGEKAAARPISPYGFHKLHQELLLDQYSSLYGLPTAKARVFSTFGPGLRHLAVWDIARRVMAGECQVWGTGQESRDYLYVKDVARALERVARVSPFEGEVVNVASGRETSIATLVEVIFAELQVDGAPVFSGNQLCGSPLRWRADVSRLSDLGFEPKWTLEGGLRETVEWIKTL